jgi:hypothetical protein
MLCCSRKYDICSNHDEQDFLGNINMRMPSVLHPNRLSKNKLTYLPTYLLTLYLLTYLLT